MAIIETIRHFEIYLRGNSFVVETDNKALEFIRGMKRGSPKLMRWAALLRNISARLSTDQERLMMWQTP